MYIQVGHAGFHPTCLAMPSVSKGVISKVLSMTTSSLDEHMRAPTLGSKESDVLIITDAAVLPGENSCL